MAVLANQTIVGTVGQIFELRTVKKTNDKVLDLSIAVTRRHNVDGEWVDGETYWVKVTMWGRLAENVYESWKTGDRVFVHGDIDVKPGFSGTNDDGSAKEIPPRPFLVAKFAGHENSYHVTKQERNKNGKATYSDRSKEEDSSNRYSETSSAPAKKAADPEPVDNSLDTFSIDDVDDGSLPF